MVSSFIISNKYYKEYMGDYYVENLDRFKVYYQNNKERLIKQSIDYYNDNRAEIRKKQNIYFKKYYEKNKDKINESRKRPAKLKKYKIIHSIETTPSLLVTF